MGRIAVAVLVTAALVVGAWMLWPDGESAGSSPTSQVAAPSTQPEGTSASTSVGPVSTVSNVETTVSETHVVEDVEEAEEILRELWFGWFEGIYNRDEDRIREVVILESTVEEGIEAFGNEFGRAPQDTDVTFLETEILRSDESCLAVWTVLTLSGFATGESGGVEVLRWTGDRWKSLSTWPNRGDLWEADCDASL